MKGANPCKKISKTNVPRETRTCSTSTTDAEGGAPQLNIADDPEQWATILDSLPLHQRKILARALASGLQIHLPRKARLDSRDEEIRRALTCCYSALPQTVGAKDFAREFNQYLSSGWIHEMDLDQLPPDTSAKRCAFHRIARLAEGRSIAWRQVLNILDGDRGR